jgi:hypothetical protein
MYAITIDFFTKGKNLRTLARVGSSGEGCYAAR